MALPAVKTLEDCAEYSKIIEPFLPQFYGLPRAVAVTLSDHGSLLDLYKTTNPFVSGLGFSIFLGFVFLLVSEVNRNYSQVDRMWSLLPTIYNAHFFAWSQLNNLPSQRLGLVLLWSVAWSVSTFTREQPR
jgi:steroid 5-alpha reductase family enzyme